MPTQILIIKKCQLKLKKKRSNYKLHPLYLVKVQFSPLCFNRFNSVSKFHYDLIDNFQLIFVNTISF